MNGFHKFVLPAGGENLNGYRLQFQKSLFPTATPTKEETDALTAKLTPVALQLALKALRENPSDFVNACCEYDPPIELLVCREQKIIAVRRLKATWATDAKPEEWVIDG